MDKKAIREFTKVSKTAMPHVFYRTFYGLPHAEEMAALMKAEQITVQLYGAYNKKQLEIVPIMEARYKSGLKAMETYIELHNRKVQILELAAGLSLHGTLLSEKYPDINYIETDYSSGIIESKKKIIRQLIKKNLPNLRFLKANALEEASFKNFLKTLRSDLPLIVYNEGLLNYFNGKEMRVLARNIKFLLSKFGGVWITPDPAMSAERRASLGTAAPNFLKLAKKAEAVAAQKYEDHGFKNEQEADKFFKSQGFSLKKFSQPTDLNSFKELRISSVAAKKIKENIKKYGKVWILSNSA